MSKAIVLCVVVCAIFTVSHFVYAEKLGIAVSENKLAFDMDILEEQSFVIKVTNVSDQEQKIIVDVVDYDVADDNKISLRSDADWENGIKEWVVIPEKEFMLSANMGKDVHFSVLVPDHAKIGSHRGAVIFRTVPMTDENVQVQGQIGVHVLVNVKGDTRATGKMVNFDVPFITLNDVVYHAVFENTGNIHYVPHGDVLVRNVITNKRWSYDLNKGDHFVLPGKKNTFEISERIPSVFGVYFAQARFVDGEGVVQNRNDLVMGYLFPIAVLSCIVTGIYGIRIIKKKRVVHS